MPSIGNVFYYAIHLQELRSIIQWKVWHDPVHRRDEESEPASLKACFDFLDKTSRSFSAVIKELNHELLVPICLFYLVLRGLDTIEDDMTIPLPKKDPLLRDFHQRLEEDGWTFDGNGPDEKDRSLLVNFHCVITELKKLKPQYKEIILDICQKMGNGMADYAHNEEFQKHGLLTVKEYEKYCYYVAGLVGEGLTRLFVEGKLANPGLAKRPDLQNSMGQFLQHTNIIRDIREDWDDKRRFWPREVWSKYVANFEDLFKPQNKEEAMRCSSEMILLALQRAPDCLFYLAGMRDQSCFNFAAIPQSMAIATLELCFRNPDIFQRNVKITKGQACGLMVQSSQNLQILFSAFRTTARRIHKKNDPRDPNFLKISVACGKIEQFVESIFPSQDPNAVVLAGGQAGADELKRARGGANSEERDRQRRLDEEAKHDVMMMGLASMGIMGVISVFMLVIAWMFGARFDLALEQVMAGNFTKQKPGRLQELMQQPRGREL